MPNKVTLSQKFAQFSEQWSPKIVSRFNGNEIRLSKAEGEYHWHSHDNTDELFLVIKGELEIDFRDRTEKLTPGEMIVVPAGVEHRPRVVNGEAELFVMDAEGTPNSGDASTAVAAVEI